MKTSFSFSARFVTRWLLGIIVALVLLHLVTQLGKQLGGLQLGARLFNLDLENTVPAYFSALQLLAASVLLAIIAKEQTRQHAPSARHWWVLALGFCVLSFDEACCIHEHLRNKGLESALQAGKGFLSFPWVVSGMLIVAVVGTFFIPFLARLDPVTRRRFILSGGLFLSGTLGMEMVAAKYTSIYGWLNVGYLMCVTVEETLEMVGVALFIRALMLYIEATFGTCAISFGTARAAGKNG